MSNRRDVQLVIRARAEGEKLVNQLVTSILNLGAAEDELGTGAERNETKLRNLAATVSTLAAVSGKLDTAADRGSAAFDRQRANLAALQAQLEQVRSQMAGAQQAIGGGINKIVDARVAGGDGTRQIAELAGAKQALTELTAQEARLSNQIRTTEAALGESRVSFQALATAANEAGRALDEAGGPERVALLEAQAAALYDEARAAEAVAAAARELGRAREQELAKAARQQAAHEAQMASWRDEARQIRELADLDNRLGVNSGKATNNGATTSALDEQARAAEAVAAAARELGSAEQVAADKAARLRREMDPLNAIQEQLKRNLKDVRDLMRSGHLTAEELAKAEAHLSREAKNAADQLNRIGKGERGKVSMFGLKPYELTNLGYQVNDVFTQLASGTSLTQTLAQQGGQILQLFPRIGASIVAALGNPSIVAAAAGLGLVVAAVVRLQNETQRLREFDGLLRSMGDGAEYSAAGLAGAVTQLRRYGVAADDAEKAVRRLVGNGVAPEYLVQMGRAAQNLARIMSIDMDQATEMVSEGLTGNWEAVQRLQEATHFLSTTEEARIRQMFQEGRASEARSQAARIFFERMEAGATQAKGPWERAWSALKRTWDGFLDSLANTAPIRAALWALEQLADGVTALLTLDFRGEQTAESLTAAIAQYRRLIEHLPEGHSGRIGPLQQIARLEAQLRALQGAQGGAAAGGDTVNNAETQRRRAAAINDVNFQRLILDLQRQQEEAITRAGRIRLAGEIEYRLALRETNDEQIAQQRRLLAEERERNRNRLTGERAIQFAIRRIIAVESGGNPNARNPGRGQTASGLGQFTDETWLNRFRHYFPERAQNMSERQILQLKTNAETARRMTELFVRENARLLQQAGLQVTALNLYFMHFLGQGGGVSFLRSAGNTPIRQAISGGAAPGSRRDRSAGAAIRANPRYLGGAGATRDSVYSRVGQRFGGEDADNEQELEAENAVLEEINRREAERAERQRQFNVQLDQEMALRQRTAEQAQALISLSGEASFAEQRRQAIENAAMEVRDRAAQQQLEVDETRLNRVREVAAYEWDIAHARERATRAVDDASGERNALIERLRNAVEDGDSAAVETLRDRIRNVDEVLDEAIQNATRFWQQFDTPESRTAIASLESLRRSIGRTKEDLQREIAQQPVDRLQGIRRELQQQIEYAERTGNMEVGRGLRRSLEDFNNELLIAIDRMIQFWGQSDRPEAAAMVMQFQNLRNEVVSTRDQFRIFAGDIQQSFAGTMTSKIEEWAQAIGEGRDVLRSTWDLARGFAADFLRSLARMLLQQLALKAAMKLGFGRVADGMNSLLNVAPLATAGMVLSGAGGKLTEAGGSLGASSVSWLVTAGMIMKAATMLAASNAAGGGGGGGVGGGISSVGGFLSGLFHGGGIAGAANRSASVWPGVFAGAPRYHRGGLAGLRPGEIPAILERGEEILTKSDARHVLNGGSAGPKVVEPRVDLQNVICMDPADWFSKALGSRPGQKTLLTFLQANSGAVKKAVGG